MESRPWPFGVTWRYRWRDHSTRGGRLPMGGPLWPCAYLDCYRDMAPQKSDGRTDARTHGHSGDFILCPMLCIALDRQKSCDCKSSVISRDYCRLV